MALLSPLLFPANLNLRAATVATKRPALTVEESQTLRHQLDQQRLLFILRLTQLSDLRAMGFELMTAEGPEWP